MILGIQIAGIMFAIAMTYITIYGYKREQISKQGLGIWSTIWLGIIILSIFPQIISKIGGKLNVAGTIDFITLIGFVFFTTLLFYLHQKINKIENRMEKLVRSMAHKEAKEKKK